MNIDVSEALSEFLEVVTLKRKSAGGRDDNGDWVDGTLTSSSIQVVAQSLTANERLALPEAARTKETVKFHSKTELRTLNEALLLDADIITYQGSDYEINMVFNRATNGGYFKAIGIRI